MTAQCTGDALGRRFCEVVTLRDSPRIVVTKWGPADACNFQLALRVTNEAFAERLGSAARTVAKWHANPSMGLTLEMQQALDTMLRLSDDDERERFALLRKVSVPAEGARTERWRRRLDSDRDLASALAGLDGICQEPSGTSRRQVEALLREGGAARLSERARAREAIDRATAADLVRNFYATAPMGYGTVAVDVDGMRHATTMLSSADWISMRTDLRSGGARFALVHGREGVDGPRTSVIASAAVRRIAEVVVGRTRFVDAPIYRMLRAPSSAADPQAAFALDTFGRYAMTWDLLEAEVADVALGEIDPLALREHLLPSVEAVLDPGGRICVGGVQAVCAFARPAEGRRPADFLVLVQERSSRVVNAAGRLAAIPKCFHQPMNDASDVGLDRTLVRELEEELFGREELDVGGAGRALADPLHATRLSEPMRWLNDALDWDMELTGFGFNLMSGNFEYAGVVAVRDERFWERYGGLVDANWEASRLRAYSSQDRDGLFALLNEPGWSDEGLVAFALGLQRLAELSPDRVTLPPLEIGVET